MKKLISVITISFSFFINSFNASAAVESFSFSKISCIPELNYFSFDSSYIESNNSYEKEIIKNGNDVIKKQSISLQQKYGLIGENDKNIYECKLRDKTLKYQIITQEIWKEKDKTRYKTNRVGLKLWVNNELNVDISDVKDVLNKGELININRLTYKYYDSDEINQKFPWFEFHGSKYNGAINGSNDYSYVSRVFNRFGTNKKRGEVLLPITDKNFEYLLEK